MIDLGCPFPVEIEERLAFEESLPVVLFDCSDFSQLLQFFVVVSACNLTLSFQANVQCADGDMGGLELQEVDLDERQIEEETSIDEDV